MVLNRQLQEQFKDSWAKFDSYAAGLIEEDDLPDFLLDLGKPLGWDESFKDNAFLQEQFLEDIDIEQDVPGKYSFLDVMESLAFLLVVNQEIANYMKVNFFSSTEDVDQKKQIKEDLKGVEKRKR